MKTKTNRWPAIKTFRPNFVSYTAQCIAQREADDDERFSGMPATPRREPSSQQRPPAAGVPLAKCCAVIAADFGHETLCGVSPAPFLDFQRGGFVCADHKPERQQ